MSEMPNADSAPSLSAVAKDDNPLIWPLLGILQASPMSWKIHNLAAELQQQGILSTLDDNNERNLFKRNFLMMNALYELQDMLLPQQWLQVQAMDIQLFNTIPDNCQLQINQDQSLREYYLDWLHYDANPNIVRGLLESFWTNYQQHIGIRPKLMHQHQALAVFDLDASASPRQLRRQWRKLALKWHPDRQGGDSHKFRQICQAWQILKED